MGDRNWALTRRVPSLFALGPSLPQGEELPDGRLLRALRLAPGEAIAAFPSKRAKKKRRAGLEEPHKAKRRELRDLDASSRRQSLGGGAENLDDGSEAGPWGERAGGRPSWEVAVAGEAGDDAQVEEGGASAAFGNDAQVEEGGASAVFGNDARARSSEAGFDEDCNGEEVASSRRGLQDRGRGFWSAAARSKSPTSRPGAEEGAGRSGASATVQTSLTHPTPLTALPLGRMASDDFSGTLPLSSNSATLGASLPSAGLASSFPLSPPIGVVPISSPSVSRAASVSRTRRSKNAIWRNAGDAERTRRGESTGAPERANFGSVGRLESLQQPSLPSSPPVASAPFDLPPASLRLMSLAPLLLRAAAFLSRLGAPPRLSALLPVVRSAAQDVGGPVGRDLADASEDDVRALARAAPGAVQVCFVVAPRDELEGLATGQESEDGSGDNTWEELELRDPGAPLGRSSIAESFLTWAGVRTGGASKHATRTFAGVNGPDAGRRCAAHVGDSAGDGGAGNAAVAAKPRGRASVGRTSRELRQLWDIYLGLKATDRSSVDCRENSGIGAAGFSSTSALSLEPRPVAGGRKLSSAASLPSLSPPSPSSLRPASARCSSPDDGYAAPLPLPLFSSVPLSPLEWVARLRAHPRYEGQILHSEMLPGRRAQTVATSSLRALLRPSLLRALPERLYSHQEKAIRSLLCGSPVVVSTPTASGKSLCFLVPAVERLLRDPKATCVFVYPTKALAHDQIGKIRAFCAAVAGADGEERREEAAWGDLGDEASAQDLLDALEKERDAGSGEGGKEGEPLRSGVSSSRCPVDPSAAHVSSTDLAPGIRPTDCVDVAPNVRPTDCVDPASASSPRAFLAAQPSAILPSSPLVCLPFDGDQSCFERDRARLDARILVTNPDALHAALLPGHASWARFLAGLSLVALDEAHVYRGAFGAQCAMVVRRLLRLAAARGAQPTLAATTATLGDPAGHLSRLGGMPEREVVIVDRDGSAGGARWFAAWNPPPVHAGVGAKGVGAGASKAGASGSPAGGGALRELGPSPLVETDRDSGAGGMGVAMRASGRRSRGEAGSASLSPTASAPPRGLSSRSRSRLAALDRRLGAAEERRAAMRPGKVQGTIERRGTGRDARRSGAEERARAGAAKEGQGEGLVAEEGQGVEFAKEERGRWLRDATESDAAAQTDPEGSAAHEERLHAQGAPSCPAALDDASTPASPVPPLPAVNAPSSSRDSSLRPSSVLVQTARWAIESTKLPTGPSILRSAPFAKRRGGGRGVGTARTLPGEKTSALARALETLSLEASEAGEGGEEGVEEPAADLHAIRVAWRGASKRTASGAPHREEEGEGHRGGGREGERGPGESLCTGGASDGVSRRAHVQASTIPKVHRCDSAALEASFPPAPLYAPEAPVTPGPSRRRPTIGESAWLLADAVLCGLQAVVFCGSRRICEVVLAMTQEEIERAHRSAGKRRGAGTKATRRGEGSGSRGARPQRVGPECLAFSDAYGDDDGDFVGDDGASRAHESTRSRNPGHSGADLHPHHSSAGHFRTSIASPAAANTFQRSDVERLLPAPRLACYRAGYSASERRDLERAISSGEVRGVVATNALELGVDVGSLDVVIHLGWPGSVSSLKQQAGRAGRRLPREFALAATSASLSTADAAFLPPLPVTACSIFVPYENAMDQHRAKNAGEIWATPPEPVPLDPTAPGPLDYHLVCAAQEMEVRAAEIAEATEGGDAGGEDGALRREEERSVIRDRRDRAGEDVADIAATEALSGAVSANAQSGVVSANALSNSPPAKALSGAALAKAVPLFSLPPWPRGRLFPCESVSRLRLLVHAGLLTPLAGPPLPPNVSRNVVGAGTPATQGWPTSAVSPFLRTSFRYAGPARPQAAMGLRAIEDERVRVVLRDGREETERPTVLEELEADRAYFSVYEGAVYLRQGQSYVITRAEPHKGYVIAQPRRVGYYTLLSDSRVVRLLGGRRSTPPACRPFAACCTPARVTQLFLGYYKVAKATHTTIDTVELSLPPREWITRALAVPVDARRACRCSRKARGEEENGGSDGDDIETHGEVNATQRNESDLQDVSREHETRARDGAVRTHAESSESPDQGLSWRRDVPSALPDAAQATPPVPLPLIPCSLPPDPLSLAPLAAEGETVAESTPDPLQGEGTAEMQEHAGVWDMTDPPPAALPPRKGLAPPLFNLRGALHAANHALLRASSLLLALDAKDLDTECDSVFDLRNRAMRLLAFDRRGDGSGAADAISRRLGEVLRKAHALLTECACEDDQGCPQCIQWDDCAEHNRGTTGEAARTSGRLFVLLRYHLHSTSAMQRASSPPPPPPFIFRFAQC